MRETNCSNSRRRKPGGEADDYSIADGAIYKDGAKAMDLPELCRAIKGGSIVGRGAWSQQLMRQDPTKGDPFGAQAVDLTVDAETGVVTINRIVAVQACGQVVCRKTAESQIIGGVTQGISYALFEDRLLDVHTGAMLNANLEWYKIAGARDVGRIEAGVVDEGPDGTETAGRTADDTHGGAPSRVRYTTRSARRCGACR